MLPGVKLAHLLLATSVLAAVAAAACATSNTSPGFNGEDAGGSAADGPTGGPSDGALVDGASSDSSVASADGAPGDGAAQDAFGGGTVDGGATGGPISFDGGWKIPDAGVQPPLVGDGGTTVEIGPGADSSSPGKFGGSPTGGALTLVYPATGVILPPNTNSIEFHFIPAAGQTLFRFTFHAPSTSLAVYTGCTPVGAGCVYTPGATFWSSLVAYARGTQPVTYSVEGVSGASPGAVGTSAQSTIAFGDQDMSGGIYYWNTAGIVERYDYGFPAAAPQQYLIPSDVGAFVCVGCHVISREGSRIAVGKDIPSPAPYTVLEVANKAVVQAGGQPVTGSSNFFSFSPDEQELLTSNGVSVTWRSLQTGATLPGPVAASGTMPDWSPDGLHMVFAKPSSPAFFAVPGVSSAAIVQQHFNGTGWDMPLTLVPFAGQNNYYPAYSPDGSWVVFDRSPQNAESFSNAAPDPDAGTVPDGELWAVAQAGGSPVRLSRASDPGACSWPKWAPVLHDYYGGKIFWLTFSSARAYGLRLAAGQQTQLWMVAFDPAKIAAGQDPSFPAFWLPFQAIGSGNHIAQWAITVPRSTCTGNGNCNRGEVCSNGSCVPG
jgi:hypothetical protein